VSSSAPVACGGSSGEIVPAADLEPDTSYVIRAASDEQESSAVRFSTGSDRAPVRTLTPPRVVASFIEGNPLPDSCAAGTYGCIDVQNAEHFELILRRDGVEVVRWLAAGPIVADALELPPECLEARARDVTGRRSEASVLCGDELPVRPARLSDFEDYAPRCEHGVIGDDIDADDDDTDTDADEGALLDSPDGGAADDRRNAGQRSALDGADSGAGCSVSAAGKPKTAALLASGLLALAPWVRARRRLSAQAMSSCRAPRAPRHPAPTRRS
jgi:hypothetical protein